MFQNKVFKKFQVLIVIVFGVLMILGSSPDKDEKSSNNIQQIDNIQQIEQKSFTTGIIELGKIEGGEVTIETLDNYVLMTLSDTDKDGAIKIDIDELKSAVKNHDSSIKLVKIISIGGIDTDPNDDGVIIESEKKKVYSSVEAIIPLDLIYTTNGYRINFITSLLSDILNDVKKEDIDKEYLDFLVSELGIYDVNRDGNITVEDIIYYDMVNNNSRLESELRATYLDTFHTDSPDTESIQSNIADDYKKYIGLAKVKVEFSNNQFSVKIIKSNKNNKVLYGISLNSLEPKLEIYNNEDLLVDNNSMLMLVECVTDDECYQEQKVYFINNKYYYNAIVEEAPKSNFLDLIESIEKRDKKINDIKKEIEDLKDK